MPSPDREKVAKVIPFPTPPRRPPDGTGKPTGLLERIVYLKKWSGPVRSLVDWAVPGFVTPNMVTWFRTALTVPIVWSLAAGRYWTAAVVFAVATSLDFLDGALAEIRQLNSASGAFLDPLADKILICGALLAMRGSLPDWINLVSYGTIFFAVAITLIRLVKLGGTRRRGESITAETVAAKPAGKLKMICDVAAVLLLMIGLAIGGGTALITAGGCILVAACGLAALSFFGQLAG